MNSNKLIIDKWKVHNYTVYTVENVFIHLYVHTYRYIYSILYMPTSSWFIISSQMCICSLSSCSKSSLSLPNLKLIFESDTQGDTKVTDIFIFQTTQIAFCQFQSNKNQSIGKNLELYLLCVWINLWCTFDWTNVWFFFFSSRRSTAAHSDWILH